MHFCWGEFPGLKPVKAGGEAQLSPPQQPDDTVEPSPGHGMPSGYSEFRSAGSTPPPSQLDAGDGDDKSDDDGPTMDRPRRLNRRSLSGWGDGLDRHLTRTLSRAAALTRTQVRSAREHYQSRNRGMVGFGWGLRSAGSAEVSRGQLEVSRFSRRSAGTSDAARHSKEHQGGAASIASGTLTLAQDRWRRSRRG